MTESINVSTNQWPSPSTYQPINDWDHHEK